MGLRMFRQFVVVRLPDGRLWIQSPEPVDDAVRAALARLGPVAHVMAPSLWHDECLAPFQAAFPDAQFHGTPGMAEAHRALRFSHVLSDTPHPDWAAVIAQHHVRGMPRMNEVVFLHRPSRSLILSDLAMNVRAPADLAERLAFSLAGAWDRFGPTRLCRRLMRDRAAVRASIDQILQWDFDRIIVGHGTTIETGGREAFREAFAFLTER